MLVTLLDVVVYYTAGGNLDQDTAPCPHSLIGYKCHFISSIYEIDLRLALILLVLKQDCHRHGSNVFRHTLTGQGMG